MVMVSHPKEEIVQNSSLSSFSSSSFFFGGGGEEGAGGGCTDQNFIEVEETYHGLCVNDGDNMG